MSAQSTIKAFTDAASDAVGREIARLRGEAKRESELRDADYRARTAELEARILSAAALERDIRDKLSELKDGVDGDRGEKGEKGDPGIGEQGPPGRDGVDGIGRDGVDGKDADMEIVAEQVRDLVAAIPPPQDGRDGHDVENIEVTQNGAIVEFAFTVANVRTEFEVELPAGPPGRDGDPGKEGPMGKMSAVLPWADEVHYEGSMRTHLGATYQALRDTAKEPPSEDWACLAERGADGRSLRLRETWSADEEYRELDIVTLNGASFAARKDDPGECPGPDWKLLASQGKRGAPGERGQRGEPGSAGPPVKAIAIDDEGLLTLENADGSKVICDLYPLLARIDRKTG